MAMVREKVSEGGGERVRMGECTEIYLGAIRGP